MGWALQMRWLWIEKTNPDLPWAGLKIPVHAHTSAMFAISVVTSIGNGKNTLFWSDRWILGCRLEDLALNVFKSVPIRVRNKRTMAEALHELTWVTDIRGALGWLGLAEYLEIWDILAGITLNTNEDAHI